MDRIKESAFILKQFNKFRSGELVEPKFIKDVCNYFDLVKDLKINKSDLSFLRFLASHTGVPHYYNMLSIFNKDIYTNEYDLSTFGSIFYESTLHTNKDNMLHKYQMHILNQFKSDKLNRYFLSASTSFGKTHVVYEILNKMNYNNILLIFPTIALLSENLERILSDNNFSSIKSSYKLHTLSEISTEELKEGKNIFILTPERYLSFIEKSKETFKIDFAFIDEVYKIDNEYLIDEESKENDRDLAYRLAVHYVLQNNSDVLLAGPYMNVKTRHDDSKNHSFRNFLDENQIKYLNYNDYEIVQKEIIGIQKSETHPKNPKINIAYDTKKKTGRLFSTINYLLNMNQNLIIYCANRGKNGGAEYYAEKIIEAKLFHEYDYSEYIDLIEHITLNFTDDWILAKSLKNGIGIHHGLIPKYLQKEIISLFNNGKLKVLLSTTTITEGVNTSTKNIIVMHNKKGNKPLKTFDAKNIAGRAGRFGFHYSGNVIDLSAGFIKLLNSESDELKHKNYDKTEKKNEIDIFYSDEKYLSTIELQKKMEVLEKQRESKVPESIINLNKSTSRSEKIFVFSKIQKLSKEHLASISKLIQIINFKLDIDYNGFQIILDTIESIVKNDELKFLINKKDKNGRYSLVTHLIHFYLTGGFKSSIHYYISTGDSVDKAITKTAGFVYNILKYHIVKYLGVFNVMYKYYLSVNSKMDYNEVPGIDKLLLKFEHNALTKSGRIANDFGVPYNVLNYYEQPVGNDEIKDNFDNYEKSVFKRVEKIINK